MVAKGRQKKRLFEIQYLSIQFKLVYMDFDKYVASKETIHNKQQMDTTKI